VAQALSEARGSPGIENRNVRSSLLQFLLYLPGKSNALETANLLGDGD
jgi:hypothetical protein